MIRAIIIDDERSGINALQLLIEKHIDGVKIVATTTKAQEGIALIEDYRPEIVFLDISMPDLTGFDLLEQLEYRNFNLVFTTAHQEYAIQAIKHHAFDYLLKPIDIDELKSCVRKIISERERVLRQGKTTFSNTIGLSVKDGIIFIRNSDIIRLEASGSYTVFYLENKVKQMASKSLKEYEAQLDPSVFYRCHNSHLVNLKKVTKFVSHDGLFAQMIDGSAAEIARKNKEQFLERLKNIG
ncbi:MAG TPA: LytTR family DNA-binding domain-containing protein [Bacteroidia bacterium]|nr:LytTR family DNA-binding domain-containing protein [Bacteroidia bacterium]